MADSGLTFLKQLASGLAAQFGSNCEIVIHDLDRHSIEHSIVHIENSHISGRKIGDGPSEIVLDALRQKGDCLKDRLAYLTKTDNGRILKSTTIYVKDESGIPHYVLAINYDITNLLALENSLHSLTDCPEEPNGTDSKKNTPHKITHDVNDLLDELIEQSVELVGVPVAMMTKDDKIKALNFLNDAGAFLITKSGDKVAKYFGISKYTLYSYVDINR